MMKLLRIVVSSKDHISYSGTFYRMEDAERLLARMLECATWAEGMYLARPR